MSSETQLASYFAKYEPAMARMGKAVRAKLRRRLPGLFEIDYGNANQDALVIAYSPTGNGYEGLCSLGIHPREVKLFFTRGPELAKSDPGRLLKGSGKSVRHVVLAKAADLDRAEIEALLAAAVKLAKVRLVAGAKGAVIVRAEARRLRARRTSGSAPRARRSTATS